MILPYYEQSSLFQQADTWARIRNAYPWGKSSLAYGPLYSVDTPNPALSTLTRVARTTKDNIPRMTP